MAERLLTFCFEEKNILQLFCCNTCKTKLLNMCFALCTHPCKHRTAVAAETRTSLRFTVVINTTRVDGLISRATAVCSSSTCSFCQDKNRLLQNPYKMIFLKVRG